MTMLDAFDRVVEVGHHVTLFGKNVGSVGRVVETFTDGEDSFVALDDGLVFYSNEVISWANYEWVRCPVCTFTWPTAQTEEECPDCGALVCTGTSEPKK